MQITGGSNQVYDAQCVISNNNQFLLVAHTQGVQVLSSPLYLISSLPQTYISCKGISRLSHPPVALYLLVYCRSMILKKMKYFM